ncbi:hypothetical protein C1646_775852 [Rhizophagus diaphanus]|nr:hypothetical protein C1646_775852 [Rhizophagus diaphanus] [Rhizophagus sp. MUCL 43196]
MPKNSNKRVQTANKFGKAVKNIKFSNKNWVISLEKFHKEAESLFPNLWKVFNRKIKYLSDFGLNEPKESDALIVNKIIQIFNHQKMDSSIPRRLLYQFFFYNAILFELYDGEYSSFLVDDFKKRPDGEEKLIFPNNPILINDYDRYLDLQPVNAKPNFYLQEVEEKLSKLKSH